MSRPGRHVDQPLAERIECAGTFACTRQPGSGRPQMWRRIDVGIRRQLDFGVTN